MKPFIKEEFLNDDYSKEWCEKFLNDIDSVEESHPQIYKHLVDYRNILWQKHLDEVERQKQRILLGDDAYNKKVIEALRAMADKLEEHKGSIIIYTALPKLPIFSEFFVHLEVDALAGPVGG